MGADREPDIRMRGPGRVQVGIHFWSLDGSQGRYAVVGYSAGKKEVLYGYTVKRLVWDALNIQKHGDMWIGAVVDTVECKIVAQSIWPDGPAFVESLRKMVGGEKRSWQT